MRHSGRSMGGGDCPPKKDGQKNIVNLLGSELMGCLFNNLAQIPMKCLGCSCLTFSLKTQTTTLHNLYLDHEIQLFII